MDEAERLHRPELARDRPIRDFVSHFRPNAGGSAPHARAPDPVDDPVAHGVKLGYSVIDEQIRQGEKLAERLRPAQAGAGARPLDAGALVERALNVYKDLGSLALAAAEALARNPSLQSGLSRAWRGSPAESGAAAAPNAGSQAGGSHLGGSQVALEIKSSRRVTVKLDLPSSSRASAPHVHALHALNGAAAPLSSVNFVIDAASRAPLLRIEIDDAQPAGLYSGLVVDSGSNEPCGTLSVRIGS